MKKLKSLLFTFAILISCQAWANDDVEIVNIENPAVQAYMADSTYNDDHNFTHTVVYKYADRSKYGSDIAFPQGKKVEWDAVAGLSDITVKLSENSNFIDGMTFSVSTKSTTYEIRNMLPGKLYYYLVEGTKSDGSTVELASGKFRTVGQVRMLKISGGYNMRDIGGWMTSFGVPIKYGKCYRGAKNDKVTAQGVHEFVDNLGVSAELDQRSECSFSKSPLGDDVDFINIPNDSYSGAMSSSKWKAAFVKDFNWIVAELKKGKIVNWHCGVGCDRCGSLSFLIEGVLGVSEADLCRDYELSCFRGFKRGRNHGGFQRVIPFIKKFGPEDDLTQCFYNYWIKAGVAAEDIEYLRNELLDYKK